MADQTVAAGEVVSSGSIYRGNQYVYGTTSDFTVEWGSQYIYEGGYAFKTTVSSGAVQKVSSGGESFSTIVSRHGEQHVYSGGIASKTLVSSGGSQDLYGAYSGGYIYASAYSTWVGSGGEQHISRYGLASSSFIHGGAQYISSGGKSINATFSRNGEIGGMQYILTGGAESGTMLNVGCSQMLSSGAYAYSTRVYGSALQYVDFGARVLSGYVGGSQFVLGRASMCSCYGTQHVAGVVQAVFTENGIQYSGGYAEKTIVSNGGSQLVYYGGSTLSTVLSGSSYLATQRVYYGGVASKTQVHSRGWQYVELGGAASNTFIHSEGHQVLQSGGIAYSTTVSGYNAGQYVSLGGVASGTVVSYGGTQAVEFGGSADGTEIKGGCLQVLDGGKAENVSQYIGGRISMIVRGQDYGTRITGNGPSGYFELNYGYARNFVLYSGASQGVGPGGVASNTTVVSYGSQAVYGGTAIDTTLSSGGRQFVFYGAASNTTISGGCEQHVSAYAWSGSAVVTLSRGSALGATLIGSGTSYTYQIVSGGIASGTTVMSGASQVVRSALVSCYNADDVPAAGSAVGTIISSGGVQLVSAGGIANNTTVKAGGSAIVSSGGLASGGNVFGWQLLSSGGLASKVVFSSGGWQYVYAGGSATDAVVRAGGVNYISGGEVTGTRVSSGGKLFVSSAGGSSGVVSAAGIYAGGIAHLRLGGSAVRAGVKAGGALYVSSGGRAVSAAVASGGSLYVRGGAKTTTMNLKPGATAYLAGGALGGTNTWSGALVNVTAPGVKVAAIRANAATLLNYDISNVSAGAGTMLTETTQQDIACSFAITAAKTQQIGTYKLSSKLNVADDAAFSIRLGTTTLGTATLGKAFSKYGVTYKVTEDASSNVKLTLSMKAGSMVMGTTGADTLTGTANSDIFYGGKGNDTITGTNGRDVVVYDETPWGQDTIQATSGTMTLLITGVNPSDILLAMTGANLEISRSSSPSQKILVRGWNDSTHNIVYADTLTQFTQYVDAASPTTAQTTAARNEVWQKAGLAASSNA